MHLVPPPASLNDSPFGLKLSSKARCVPTAARLRYLELADRFPVSIGSVSRPEVLVETQLDQRRHARVRQMRNSRAGGCSYALDDLLGRYGVLFHRFGISDERFAQLLLSVSVLRRSKAVERCLYVRNCRRGHHRRGVGKPCCSLQGRCQNIDVHTLTRCVEVPETRGLRRGVRVVGRKYLPCERS